MRTTTVTTLPAIQPTLRPQEALASAAHRATREALNGMKPEEQAPVQVKAAPPGPDASGSTVSIYA